VKLVVRACADDYCVTAELFVNSCYWDADLRQLSMTHGIGDGYYVYPLDTPIRPKAASRSEDGMVIEVEDPSHVHQLAAVLKREDDHCMESFGRMRV
jgi:hypothetical protein